MNATDLSALKDSYMKEYESYQCKNLKLDMSRGKPGPDQLILSAPMLDVLSSQSALSALDGTDCRNYGCLDGIPEAKELSLIHIYAGQRTKPVHQLVGQIIRIFLRDAVKQQKLQDIVRIKPGKSGLQKPVL